MDTLPTERPAIPKSGGRHTALSSLGIAAVCLLTVPGVGAARHTQQVSHGYVEQVPAPDNRGAQQSGQGGVLLRYLRDKPPAEQERFMARDLQFKHLPPERQEQIREDLRRWNAMSAGEKDKIRQREQSFLNLSPQQRQEARATYPVWRDLPPERRQAVMRAFRRLRDMSPEDRRRYLASSEVRDRFSPQERQLLEGLGKLLPEGRTNPPGSIRP